MHPLDILRSKSRRSLVHFVRVARMYCTRTYRVHPTRQIPVVQGINHQKKKKKVVVCSVSGECITPSKSAKNPRAKTDDNRNAMLHVFFQNYSKKKSAEDTVVPPLWGKREKNVWFLWIICSRCCTRRNLRFHVENCRHADQKQVTRR